MMLETTWERAEPHENAFIAWLCYDTTISALKPRKSLSDVKADMFGSIEAAAKSDDVVTAGWQDHRMRLPYTAPMLERRAEYGRDVPSWWKQVDTFTLEAA